MKPTKIGDVVRFNSHIQSEDGGILSLERGIVVSFSEDRRKCDVVWNDGERGPYRCKDLARMPGTVGDIANSSTPMVGSLTGKVSHQPLRTSPMRDRGHKPVRAPVRTMPDSLPRRAATWSAVEIKRVEGVTRPLTKPIITKTGKVKDSEYLKFRIPIVTLDVRADHWGEGDAWTITRSRFGLKVQFKDGSVERVKGSYEREWLMSKGGPEFAKRVLSMCNPS
jgi:hypothetical protein